MIIAFFTITRTINQNYKDTFINESNLFYVGASRARLFLDVITTINENDCVEVLNEIDPEGEYGRTRKGL